MAKLFSKSKESAMLLQLLEFIVQGTRSGTGAAVPVAMADKIEKFEPGLISKVTGAVADPAGNIAVFATSKGVAAIGGGVEAPVVAADSTKQTFVLEDGHAVPPASKRGGVKGDIYPFALMAVGQSFFVPATEKRPNPGKALFSTISSANARFAATYPATYGKDKKPHPQAGQSTGKDGRKFTVRARTMADGEKSNGARVYRIS